MKKHVRHHPAGEEWLAIRSALESPARTVRLCAIYLVRCTPYGCVLATVLIKH
jgi:hypothetical protein